MRRLLDPAGEEERLLLLRARPGLLERFSEAGAARRLFDELTACGKNVILDFADQRAFRIELLGALVAAQCHLRKNGRSLVLLGPRPRTAALIKFLCLDALLPCCRELSEARQHLQRRGAA